MRGQISIEFLVIMGLAVVMLVVFLAIGADQLQQGASEAREARVIDITQVIQQELATAVSVRDGYRRTFTLPFLLEQQSYSISQQNASGGAQVVTVLFKNRVYSVRAPQCVGSLTPGRNVLRTENGTVYCNA